ncbi:tRNA lysidine(34) synthetase TilS [Halobacillus sp. Marseille-Q1614]|uniref:tRNA lysidine(34) synthetase TilS n=1 Tax=Halobacillus sp. Marseille-Q1614 TaxID=2709134 RepID=UPI001571230E|nr:tRNA lysidine(34) synthetase TilS [Halobacillus sp. Marseille-Q1614]
MRGTVHSFIKKHNLVKRNQTIVVAVSGGPDSLALLHFFIRLKEDYQLRIIAASVDHGLRGEDSLEDVRYVKEAAHKWGAEFYGTSVDVPAYKKEAGIGTQEAARDLRYQFLAKVMDETGADQLALGHHGDDQAETMLMQLTRSALPEAVHGMPVKRPFANGWIIRPFLCLSKAEIQQYCEQNGLKPRIDASNEDTEYTRNAFRKHVLPFLKEINPKLHEHMQHMSERVTEDRTFMKSEAEKVLKNVDMTGGKGGHVHFSKTTFQKFPLALQRTAFHLILNYLYGNQIEEISFIHEEMFFHLLQEQKPNASLDFPRELRVIRAYDAITFTFSQSKEETAFHASLYIGKQVTLPDGSMISLEAADSSEESGKYVYTCDSNHVTLPLIVRTRRPGDRIKLRGMNGSKKVKDIFIDQKIPAQERDTWPLVTDLDGQVLWLVGLRKGEGCTRNPSGTWLRLQYKNN